MSERLRDILILLALGLAVFLPGIASLPIIDRDEARYAQAAVQMVETGDYLDIRFQDEARYKKPVGAYWAQVAGLTATGQLDDVRAGERPIWAQRLPSVVGACLAVLFTYLAGVRLFGRREALVGAALLAVSVSLVFEAHQAKTDAMLAGACAAVLYGWVSRGAWAVWLGLATGVLLKGPVIVGVAGFAWTSWWVAGRFVTDDGGPATRAGTLELVSGDAVSSTSSRKTALAVCTGRPSFGWLLSPVPILTALLLTLPWFVAIGIISDGAFYGEALGRDFGAKLGSAQETHGGPPGYYLLTTLIMFWPGILALPLAGVWAWRERKTPAVALLLCWLVPMWVVLEFVPTKLPHYTLPLYPALALLCGAAVASGLEAVAARATGIVLFALVGLGLAYFGLIAAFGPGPGNDRLLLGTTGIMGLAVLVASAWEAWKGDGRAPIIAGVVVTAGFFGVMAHPLGYFGISNIIQHNLEEAGLDGRLVSPDYREPSLVYLNGTDTRLSMDEIKPGDVLLIDDSPVPRCAEQAVRPFEGTHYVKGVGRYWLSLLTTSACDAAELETWRRGQASRATDGGS